MAKIRNPFTVWNGKLFDLVGFEWRGIPVVRRYVKPSNPNTPAQQGIRNVFRQLVNFGKRIYYPILLPYILPRPRQMTALNVFVRRKQSMISSGIWDVKSVSIGVGSLYLPSTMTMSIDKVSDEVTVTWSTEMYGTAESTDKAIVVVRNDTRDVFAYDDTKQRSDGGTTVSINVAEGDLVIAYQFFVKGELYSSDTNRRWEIVGP